jgi:antitoxin (DNA-binding transcriptional repressor) of toxin-antitoxin stability system
MKIFADIPEAAGRLEELMDLARRDDEVIICRAGRPIAVLTAFPETGNGTMDDVLALAAEGRPTIGGQTSNDADFDDENGLPK